MRRLHATHRPGRAHPAPQRPTTRAVVADICASLQMVCATLLWSLTRWRHDDGDILFDCAGACVLANAAALLLWLSGSHPQWALQIWGLHAAGAAVIHGAAALAQRRSAAVVGGDLWWSPATYLIAALVTGWMAGPPG